MVEVPISLPKPEEHLGYLEPLETIPVRLIPMLIPTAPPEPDSLEPPNLLLPAEPQPDSD